MDKLIGRSRQKMFDYSVCYSASLLNLFLVSILIAFPITAIYIFPRIDIKRMGGYTKRHFYAKQHMLGKTVQEKIQIFYHFFKINMSFCRPMVVFGYFW
jgi:hypothetical protein